MKKIIIFGLIVVVSIFTLYSISKADNVTLQWDANSPAPDGYRIYQRITGETYDYDNPVCDTTETSCIVSGLNQGIQYYFVARAYVGSESSGDSNEVNHIPPVPAPVNLRISLEISVIIDVNGVPYIAQKPMEVGADAN